MIDPTRRRRSDAAAATMLRRERIDERLRELPRRARMLLAGLDNSENDATLLFEGLPYADAMTSALRDIAVRDALAALPAGWCGWAR